MTLRDYWFAFLAIFYKEVTRIFRIWPQSLLPSVITMTLYFLIFGKVIGSRVGYIHGVSYIHYITPGLIVMAVTNNTYANIVGSFFGDRFSRCIEEMYIAPLNAHIMIFGYVSGAVFRGLIVGVLVSIVAMLFGALSIYSLPLMIVALLLSSVAFALGGLVNGIFSQKFDDTQVVSTFFLLPLTYLGGVFFSLSMLPPLWRAIAQFNPIFYIVDFFRYASLGAKIISPWFAASMVCLVIIILYMVCYHCIKRGVKIKS
ncbi:ABC transporter permease [Thiotrichales bacterium 19S3-7]|nr:ABC transporter permease [Thiotrichales bacterium 19S3-7]MCF6801403.1 ABC transporter permease [Thiotrichales bacterium 19S3-11]